MKPVAMMTRSPGSRTSAKLPPLRPTTDLEPWAGTPHWKRDGDIPWTLEARAFEAMDLPLGSLVDSTVDSPVDSG